MTAVSSVNNDDNDAIAEEDTVNHEIASHPPTQNNIRITQKYFSIREILLAIENEALDLAPDFQRPVVWNTSQQVRLIESILMGIPLPAFYFNQDKQGGLQVIDGVQRLTTIKRFVENQLSLNEGDLTSLPPVKNLTYAALDNATKRRFANTQIAAYIIEPQTPAALKFDIFKRINTGNNPLSAQEIRHCLSQARSREFLKRLVELPSFDEVTLRHFWRNKERDGKRMVNREFALRFCAFYLNPLEGYSTAIDLDAWLLECSQKLDQPGIIDDNKLRKLEGAFDQAMQNAWVLLGEQAFRRYQGEEMRRGPLNRAVFESQALALANYSLEILRPHQAAIKTALLGLFAEEEYDKAVGTSTGDYSKLKHRLAHPKVVLKEILGC